MTTSSEGILDVINRIALWPLEQLEDEYERTRLRIERDQMWVVQINCAIVQKRDAEAVNES